MTDNRLMSIQNKNKLMMQTAKIANDDKLKKTLSEGSMKISHKVSCPNFDDLSLEGLI